ncbi:MAG: ABC transporter permease, partial [Anaerolinea sp.]|nr:ABC transporter permease [Anaerolinea sp.]
LGILPFGALRALLLFNARMPSDTAIAVVILIALLNLSLLLVLLVGVTARELWLPPALVLVLAGNLATLIALGYTPGLLAIAVCLWGGASIVGASRALRINPVMLRELRGRMRGARAFVVLTVYLMLMSAFALLLYLTYRSTVGGASSAAGEIGRVLFIGVVGIELILIVFIAPAFTAGAITGERERQTYDLLRTTLLNAPSFVFGKLESALGYIFLLLLAGIPLQALAFLFGGVSEIELLLAFVILAVTAAALSAIGLYFSALAERTLAASTRAYSLIVVGMFVVPIVGGALVEVMRAVLLLQPASSPVIEAMIVYAGSILTSLNPAATALATQQVLLERQSLGFWSYTLATSGATIPLVSPWIPFIVIYLGISAALIVLAIRRIQSTEL